MDANNQAELDTYYLFTIFTYSITPITYNTTAESPTYADLFMAEVSVMFNSFLIY